MFRFFPRWLARVLAVVVPAIGGYALASGLNSPGLGVLLAVLGAASFTTAVDAVPGYRLLGWLRRAPEQSPPELPGLWGEIALRVERGLRTRDREITAERIRLAQFLSAVDASPNGVILLDAHEQIEWFSSVAGDHLQLTPIRDVKQRITNLVRNPLFVTYLHLEAYDEPLKMLNPRGQGTLQVYVRAYGEGLKLVLTQDITERERAEVMRRDFVANVSHEIRTPLTVLAGFIETMSQLTLTEVERRRVLTLMSQQTGRMQTLVADLLTLAQLEGSPRPPLDRWVSVGRLFGQIESDARALSGGRHQLVFTRDDETRDVQIAGIESEIQSALANLVSNAVRYTPEGGRIEVTWKMLPDGQGEFAVSDTGIGIDREHLPRLTERFYRVDGSRSRETGGTGLGLSIVKHVAQRHSGELRIDSEIGKGSRFSILFPAGRLHVLPHEAEAAAVAASAVVG